LLPSTALALDQIKNSESGKLHERNPHIAGDRSVWKPAPNQPTKWRKRKPLAVSSLVFDKPSFFCTVSDAPWLPRIDVLGRMGRDWIAAIQRLKSAGELSF
jgi:hypothetical protein